MSIVAKWKRKKRLTLADFLRHASLSRALRREKRFRQGGPGRYLVIVPQGHRPADYETAAMHLIGDFDPTTVDRLLDHSVDTVKRDRVESKSKVLHLQAAMHDRLILLADDVESVSSKALLGIDRVVRLDPPTLRQWKGALNICADRTASEEDLACLAALPFDLVELALRPTRSIKEVIAQVESVLNEEKRDSFTRQPRTMTIDALPGYGPAADWARDLAVDLAEWRAGCLPWSDVDRGVLLSGPPGTGKTTFAAALATTCSAHLVAASVARWQACGHLGDLLKAMRKDFADARKNAPSILFIDEFDSIGDRARFTGDSAHYCTEVVNGLLECVDGLDDREGVIVVGACNNPTVIDPALLRPGRLDRHIEIPLPDETARAAILAIHAGELLDEAARAGIAHQTGGFSGADLEALARRARRHARKASRTPNIDDFLAELPERRPIPPNKVRIAAVHEAGHAVLAALFGHQRVLEVEIAATYRIDGALQRGGHTELEARPMSRRTRDYYCDEIAMMLGGIAAEALVYGAYDDGGGGMRGSDLHLASDLATIIETGLGLGDSLVYHEGRSANALEQLRRTSPTIRERVDETLELCFERASALLGDHRSELDQIAGLLVANRKVDGEAVHAIVEASGSTELRLSG